jgi:type I restriction-modification system DNA methylase subunit
MDVELKETDHKEMAPKIVQDLIERFKRNLSAYKSKGYNEAQLREEFINPFFEVLGWDVYNKSGAAPQYRDVIHEDSIKIGGGTKAPDYCFTLAGRRMFFVEVKKPSVDIKNISEPAYQLRRYQWSATLPLSILTNFEEIIVYSSKQKPKGHDKPSTDRIKVFNYTEFVDKWDEIFNIFSKKAVLQGSFDNYAIATKKQRGTQEVDDEFLKEIEEWRERLARNIALRNPAITVEELNTAVQRTIDRIIFLRMCEDRGIEKYGALRLIAEKDNIYENLCKVYQDADDKYNSGLFHFKKERGRNTLPDELTLNLKIDDRVLKYIFRYLYYPNSPYEFSVISTEILGNVYEQFLGKIIRLTERHRAKVEEKPEVKKAGGVYYTPNFIVNFIVNNTVGKLCGGKTPNQTSKLKILDPACGSGSFLLGAYSYLLEYHLNYYLKSKNPNRHKEQIYQGKNEEWNLTIKEKKRILLNNIYGVDIDNQAVEVTKLSLLLKVLEGESRDVFEKQQKLWKERALPDLGNNIKCGNSLLGPDFYDGGIQATIFDEEKIIRLNAFDWNNEFNDIMEMGGFDAVIGNPPYVRSIWLKDIDPVSWGYYRNNYEVAKEREYDIYLPFLEKGWSLLNKNGVLGYIMPNKWLHAKMGEKTRQIFSKSNNIHEIINKLRVSLRFSKAEM